MARPAETTDPVQSRRLLSVIAVAVLVGTALSAMFHYVRGVYLGEHYPANTFLYEPRLRFSDFFTVYRDVTRFHPGVSRNMAYSPFLHVVMSGLTVLPARLAFSLVVAAFLATLALVIWRAGAAIDEPVVRLQQVVMLGFLSYPVLFVLDRGNLDMVIFVFLAAFFYLYYERRSSWAWLPLAMAIAGKYYWAVFVVLLLSDRSYRQALLACAGSVALTVGSVLLIPIWSGYTPLGVLAALRHSLAALNGLAGTATAADHGHSLWSVWLAVRSHVPSQPPATQGLYAVLAVVLFAYVVYHVVWVESVAWRKVTLLLIAALALPYIDTDYTLIHLYFGLALFVVAAPRGWRAWLTLGLFALLLVPVDYVDLSLWLTISTFVYPAALLVMAGLLIAWGAAERAAADDESRVASRSLGDGQTIRPPASEARS